MARSAIAYLSGLGQSSPEDEPASPPGEDFEIVAVVREQGPEARAGLGEALERLADGEASTLLVDRLAAVAGSLRELVALLDWLAAAGASLIVRDVQLDSRSRAGRRTIALLRELQRAERDPPDGRPVRGRPGLAARAPELSRRIGALRESGLSLQAIADALNAEDVPTQRGGAKWRPSSVQAALGYRRPGPPLPGAPPPPPIGPPGTRPGRREPGAGRGHRRGPGHPGPRP